MPATLLATEPDILYIVNLSARVQARLATSGSLQQIAVAPSDVAAMVQSGYAHLLVDGKQRLGSVFVAPASMRIVSKFGLVEEDRPIWFLSKLMVEPGMQGRGLGNLLLDAAKDVTSRSTGLRTLDCWAGNAKLRAFYTAAGFTLHGIFAEEDFEVAVLIWKL